MWSHLIPARVNPHLRQIWTVYPPETICNPCNLAKWQTEETKIKVKKVTVEGFRRTGNSVGCNLRYRTRYALAAKLLAQSIYLAENIN